MSIRRRLALVALAYLVVVAVGGLTAGIVNARRADAVDRLDALRSAEEQAILLRSAYVDQETGERGFVLVGEPSFLVPYQQGVQDAATLLALLATAADAHSSLTGPLADVAAAGQAWGGEADEAIAARRQGATAEDLATQGDAMKGSFDRLRVALDGLDAQIAQLVRTAQGEQSEAGSTLVVVLVATFAGGLAVAVLAVLAVERWVTRPIDRLVGALRTGREGTGEPVPTDGPRELAEVGRAVEEMRRTIVGQRDLAVRAREAMEQTATVVLQLRAELAGDLGDFPDGWTVAAGLQPAEGLVAGDCYDVSLISPHLLAVLVLDISGHGAGPAITALKSKEIACAALRSRMEPGPALGWLHRQLGELDEEFLTAFLAVVDTVTGRVRYANAGHPPALIVQPGVVIELEPTGPLLGPFPVEWMTREAHLGAGGRLVVYTDGLTESRAATREFYGDARLVDVLQSVEQEDAPSILKTVFDDLAEFRPGRGADDVTLVVVGRDA